MGGFIASGYTQDYEINTPLWPWNSQSLNTANLPLAGIGGPSNNMVVAGYIGPKILFWRLAVRSVQKVSTTIYFEFLVLTPNMIPVTGVTSFTTLVSKNGVNNALTVTITEVSNGRYIASCAPGSTGLWHIAIFPTNTNYIAQGGDEEFDVTTDGVLGVATLFDNFTIDGYTLRQAIEIFGAALAGKSSGGPTTPVIRSMNDGADRISASVDSSGNRTSVTLTP